jgi:hypothetical protein
MGIALSVFKLVNPDRKLLLKKEFSSKHQKTLERWVVLKVIDVPDSKLKGIEYDEKNDRVKYKAKHYSETIKHPVRVFIDNIDEEISAIRPDMKEDSTQEFDKGYQQVFIFDVIVDFKTNEIFVFTKKDIAKSFMSRFKNSKRIEYENFEFDLNKIDMLAELENVFGAWEDVSKGRLKTKAYFGTQVHKEIEVGKDRITAYNIEYLFEDDIVDLFISRDCRISTHSSDLTNEDLLKIYYHLKEKLFPNNKI